MSALFDLVLWVPPEHCKDTFHRVVSYLLAASGCEKLGIGLPGIGLTEVSVNRAEEQLRRDIETQAGNRWGLIDAGVMHRLADGNEVLLGVTLRTSRDNRLENGIHAWMIHSDLMRSYFERFPSVQIVDINDRFHPPGGLPGEEFWYAAWRISQNFEDVLLLILDAVSADVPITHAGLRWEESCWEGPLRARLIFHSDIVEFARDFLRLYLEVRWPPSWPLTSTFDASPSDVLIELESKEVLVADEDMMIRVSDDVWIGTTCTREEIIEYFRFLTRERAVRWANADAATVERALLAAAKETSKVSAKRLPGGGWSVSTHAFNNLREFYFTLGLLLDRETANS